MAKTYRIAVPACLLAMAICSTSCSTSTSAIADKPAQTSAAPQGGGGPGGPQLGQKPNGGMVVDKSSDAQLQAMIKTVVPKFKQYSYLDAITGDTIRYNLYSPANAEPGKKYPVLLFIADASTPGDNILLPLTQGYGGIIWATDEWQSEHPCFVLVPQFSGVAVNDDYQHTAEVDAVARLVQNFALRSDVDSERLYTTGQSMGGMISMYYNVTYPQLFAASVFVDSHWATSTFPELAKHKFVYFIAGNEGKAFKMIDPLEKAATADGKQVAFAEWSAKLPEAEQDSLADALFAKKAPINLIEFAPKSVLPDDGKGSEHMMSFDYAYKVKAVREWLFRQKK